MYNSNMYNNVAKRLSWGEKEVFIVGFLYNMFSAIKSLEGKLWKVEDVYHKPNQPLK